MRDERVGHTLQPTALVHEAFLRLVDQSRADWQNRAQFLGVAAQLKRHAAYFGGLSVEETAEAMGIATRTVKLDWAMAKGWMQSQLSPGARP